ncbi:MAG: class I SAM-dependent methyltransferase [Myxococcota bacterium]
MSRPAPLELVCVTCRALDAAGVHAHVLEARGPETLLCPGCAAEYPVVDGVALVLPSGVYPTDPLGALDPAWPPPVDAWCQGLASADPATPSFVETTLLGTYGLGHLPGAAPTEALRKALAPRRELSALVETWLNRHTPPRDLPILELGSALGTYAPTWLRATDADVALLELRPSMARLSRRLLRGERVSVPWRRVARQFVPISLELPGDALDSARVHHVIGDALAPPFLAERFGLVVAFGLIDAIWDPWVLLGQLDALVAPGGLLLLAQPFHYEPHAQPPDAWLDGPAALRRALAGGLEGLEHLDFRVLEEADAVPWPLPAHNRLVHHYMAHVLLATRASR